MMKQERTSIKRITLELVHPSMYIACENGHVDIATYLHEERGADIEKSNSFGTTPFFVACDRGHEAVCEALILFGVDTTASYANRSGLDLVHASQRERLTSLFETTWYPTPMHRAC